MSIQQNFQIHLTRHRLVPNFKLCKVIYNLEQDKYDSMVVEGKQRKILEKKKFKKYGDIVTVYKISNSDDYDNTDPLNEFDYAVFSVCVSHFDKGNHCITLAMIYRGLTGKGNTARMTLDLREVILISLKKLIGTIIEIDDSQANSAFRYDEFNNSKKYSSILPAHFDETLINGNDASVVFFDRISPLMEIALQRKQLLTYETVILDAPNIRNTFMNIMLKNYVLRRVVEIKLHKKMRHIITFNDVFKKCRIEGTSRDTKMNARNIVIKFFEHLQATKFIRSFEVIKKENTFYSINFAH